MTDTFPAFDGGKLLFCDAGGLSTHCCDYYEDHDEDDDDHDYDHGDYDYCYEDEIPDPCDPYPVPQQWYIGSVCHWSPCDNYEMEAIDITLMGIEGGCQQPNFIHYENWPLGDVVYELSSSRVARQVFFKLYVDSALVSSTAVDVPPDEAYEYRSIAPEALTDMGAHHVRLLIQWEQDGYCEGQMRTRVAEVYTWCQAKPTVTFDDYVVYPGELDERAQVQLAINKAEPDFDGMIVRILGPYDTVVDANTVTGLFSDKIAHYAHACECPPDCGIGNDVLHRSGQIEPGGPYGEWIQLEDFSGDNDVNPGGCELGAMFFDYNVYMEGHDWKLRFRNTATGTVAEYSAPGEGNPTELHELRDVRINACEAVFVDVWFDADAAGYLEMFGKSWPEREELDCRFNDTEDAWYDKWYYDTGDCDAGVPGDQDQLDHYNANCGGMASLLLGEMPERLV